MNLNVTSVLFVQQPPFCDCSPTLEDRSYSINKLPLIQCTSCDRSFTGFLSPDQSTGHGNFNPTNEVPCTFRFRCHWFDHHMGTSADRDSDMQPNCLYWLAWRLHRLRLGDIRIVHFDKRAGKSIISASDILKQGHMWEFKQGRSIDTDVFLVHTPKFIYSFQLHWNYFSSELYFGNTSVISTIYQPKPRLLIGSESRGRWTSSGRTAPRGYYFR
jgi:hypothetical protein